MSWLRSNNRLVDYLVVVDKYCRVQYLLSNATKCREGNQRKRSTQQLRASVAGRGRKQPSTRKLSSKPQRPRHPRPPTCPFSLIFVVGHNNHGGHIKTYCFLRAPAALQLGCPASFDIVSGTSTSLRVTRAHSRREYTINGPFVAYVDIDSGVRPLHLCTRESQRTEPGRHH